MSSRAVASPAMAHPTFCDAQSLSTILHVPNRAKFDLAAIVTRVESPVRIRREVHESQSSSSHSAHAAPTDDGGPFYEYRWVHLRDNSCKTELAVQVFSNSQPVFFRELEQCVPLLWMLWA